MNPRLRKILWGAFIVLVGVGLFWAYRRFIINAPASAFEWQKDGVTYELLGSSGHELHYEVIVPFNQKLGKLTKLIRGLDERHGMSVDWDIKKYKMLKP